MSEDAAKRSEGEKKAGAPEAEPRRRMWGAAVALAGVLALGCSVGCSSQSSSGEAGSHEARRATGVVCGYQLEMPPGWHALDAKELGQDKSPGLDLALGREDGQGAALVLVEKVPPGFAMEPRRYLEILAGNMKKNAPGTALLDVEPLAQDKIRGFVQHLEMPDSLGPREGYLATLLTSQWGFRIVATAPKEAFAARKADLLKIIASFAPPAESGSPAGSSAQAAVSGSPAAPSSASGTSAAPSSTK